MAHLIPSSAIDCYTAAPSPTKVADAVSLHNTIRNTLGSGYETFLQGSYKNDTGVADINDVDIIALRKNTTSSVFTVTTPTFPITWEQIFQEVQSLLESSYYYRGKTKRGDKCITVNTNFKADVVPAIYIASNDGDPISVYSFREQSERKNYPRVHYQNNVLKHARTSNSYKPNVRMFKRWVRNWFPETNYAPSFYVECLIYNIPNEKFLSDFAMTFYFAGKYIVDSYTKFSVIYSVAGDKDILTANEWRPEYFEVFQARLKFAVLVAERALTANSAANAQKYWREAFNE